jgi:hypothetical protein
MRLEDRVALPATRTSTNIARNFSLSCLFAIGYDSLLENPGISVSFLGAVFVCCRDSFLFTGGNASFWKKRAG